MMVHVDLLLVARWLGAKGWKEIYPDGRHSTRFQSPTDFPYRATVEEALQEQLERDIKEPNQ